MTTVAVAGTSAITPQLRTKEALYILHNKLSFVKKLTNFSDKFKGGSTGRTFLIGKPAQWSVRSGYALSANATVEPKVSLTIGDPIGIDAAFFDSELELDFPNYKQRVLEGQMKKLATAIEVNILTALMPQIDFGNNSASLTTADMYRAGRILDTQLADGDRFGMLQSQLYEDYLAATAGQYNPQIDITEQIREGVVGDVAGFKIIKNLLIPNYSTGTRTTVSASNVVKTTVGVQGATSITLTTVGATDTIYVGEFFTIANVFDVNPETKASSTILHRFAAQPDATLAPAGYYTAVANTVTITILPVYDAGDTVGDRQTVTVLPIANAVVTFYGAASSSFSQGLFFDPRMAAIAFVDLPLHTGAVLETWKETDPELGLTLRYERGYNIQTGVQYTRWDVQYGTVLVQNNFASRYIRTA